ncbi:MAG: hypothetical protein WBD31_09935 [Rubripirellula sp.]
MLQNAAARTLKACPRCGIPLLGRFGDTDANVASCRCDVSLGDGDAELPDDLILAIHTSQFRDKGVETGAICGAISFAGAAMLFTLFPAAWLVWDTQLPWRFFEPFVVSFILWVIVGSLFGAVMLRVLAVVLSPSRLVMQAAVTGFFIGFALGATIGALCVFIQYVVWQGHPIDDVWFSFDRQLTRSAQVVGLLFALIGCWAGAIVVRSRIDPRLRSTPKSVVGSMADGSGDRFQFGIAKMLFFTGAIAVMIAVPVQIFGRLRSVQRIENYILAYEVMALLIVIMLLPFVVWATFRWPTRYRKLRDSLTRWQQMDHLRSKD